MISNKRVYVTGWDHFESNEVGFRDLYQMFRMVTEQVGQEPIIIDADDLLKQPGMPVFAVRLPRVLEYSSTTRVVNYSSNFLLLEFISISGWKFHF